MPAPERRKPNWQKKDGIWKDYLDRELDKSVTAGLDMNTLGGLEAENEAFLKKILSPVDYGRIIARKKSSRARAKR